MTAGRSRPAIEWLWRRDLPGLYWPLWAVLTPVAALYAGALAARSRWWGARAARAGVTTVSVGNLTVGGNGKTPFTLYLASLLRARGIAVAILSRGWRRTGEGAATAALVSDGVRILLTPREAGDEPVMMARVFAGPIAVARHRIDGAALLTANGAVDVIILDDGFQHLRLKRDLDLVLISSSRGFGNGWLLPAGPMRESPTALKRADAIVLVDTGDAAGDAFALADRVPIEGKPLMRALIRPRGLVAATPCGWLESPLALAGNRVAAVSGLANPGGFHAMLRGLGATIASSLEFPDHHDYSPYDWERIIAAATGADIIVTTEKDLVKLEQFSSPPVPIRALRLEVSMDPREVSGLLDMIAERIRTARETAPLPGASLTGA